MEKVTPHNLKSAQLTHAMTSDEKPRQDAGGNSPEHKTESGAVAKAVGNFAHDNSSFFTKNPICYGGYHFLRSAVASIPYGLGAAAVYNLKNAVLRDLGPERAESKTARVLKSPFLAAVQIAASFTFYRTGSFTMRRMHERVFDKDNTRDDTIHEVSEIPANFWNDFADNLKVQGHSVPWAALSLGYIAKMGEADPEILEAAKGKPTEIVTHQKGRANLLNQMGRNTIAYSVFFEAADALAKHYRLQRGIADPTLPLSQQKDANGETVFKLDDPDKKYGFFTNDSGAGRLMFRRLVPAAVGIGAYTAAKRLGYRYSLTGKQAEEFYKAGEGSKAYTLDDKGSFLSTAWREGFATSMFAVYTVVKDPWEHAYDKFFNKLEKKAKENSSELETKPKTEVLKDDAQNDGKIKSKPAHHASIT